MRGTYRWRGPRPRRCYARCPCSRIILFPRSSTAAKTVTLRGVVSKVEWINPHIFIYVDVKDDAGKTTTWALQSLPPLFFRGSGLTKDVLLSNKQEVTFTANPAKDGSQAYGFLTKLGYPDGHVFSMSAQDADPESDGRRAENRGGNHGIRTCKSRTLRRPPRWPRPF